MKAPVKIYRQVIGARIEYSDFRPTKTRFDQPDADEYIRKDAILEWLKQNKQEMEQDLKGSDGLIKAMIATAISSFQEVIEKIESL